MPSNDYEHLKNCCDIVRNSVHKSSLNYNLQETPWSIYITIRKSFAKKKVLHEPDDQAVSLAPGQPLHLLPDHSLHQDVENQLQNLKIKLKKSEDANNILTLRYEEAVQECEENHFKIEQLENKVKICEKVFEKEEELEKSVEIAFDEIKLKDRTIEQLQKDKSALENEKELEDKKWKDAKKALNAKEKEISALLGKNSDITKKLSEVQCDLSTLTNKVNKDKKDDEKKQKKDKKKDFLDKLKPSDNFECSLCDYKTETLMKLESHKKMLHTESRCTETENTLLHDKAIQHSELRVLSEKNLQTEDLRENNFKKYPCFYCGTNIAHEYHLNEHRKKCRGTRNMSTDVGLPPAPFGSLPGHSAYFTPFGLQARHYQF